MVFRSERKAHAHEKCTALFISRDPNEDAAHWILGGKRRGCIADQPDDAPPRTPRARFTFVVPKKYREAPLRGKEPISGTSLITIRLPCSLVERADALLHRLLELEETLLLGRPSRSIVLRLAVLRGLAQLEAQACANEPGPPKRPVVPRARRKDTSSVKRT